MLHKSMDSINFHNLEWLIAPTTPTVFFNQYWEKEVLVVSRESDLYYGYLSEEHYVQRLITRYPLMWGPIQIANSTRGDGWEDFTTETVSTRILAKALSQGDTLVLNDVQQYCPVVAVLCRKLEYLLNSNINANLYYTPTNAQGLLPHFDIQDVFILQLKGAKTWHFQNSDSIVLPLENSDIHEPSSISYNVATLRSGDLMYMPRGTLHYATTSSEFSVHLTVTIPVLRWKDALQILFEHALDECANTHIEFRKALPIGFFIDRRKWAQQNNAFAEELVKKMLSQTSLSNGMHSIARYFINRMRPLNDDSFSSIRRAASVTLETVVRRAKGVIPWIEESGERVVLRYPGNALSLPVKTVEAVHFTCEHTCFTPSELPNIFSQESKLRFVRRLLTEGFLQISTDEKPNWGDEFLSSDEGYL